MNAVQQLIIPGIQPPPFNPEIRAALASEIMAETVRRALDPVEGEHVNCDFSINSLVVRIYRECVYGPPAPTECDSVFCGEYSRFASHKFAFSGVFIDGRYYTQSLATTIELDDPNPEQDALLELTLARLQGRAG